VIPDTRLGTVLHHPPTDDEGPFGPGGRRSFERILRLISGGAPMTLSHPPALRRHAFQPGTRRTATVGWLLGVALVVMATACRDHTPDSSSTRGSGASVTDHRDVAPFTTVELAGANTVVVHVGAPQSVEVTGDDNLVGRVTTVVRDGRLVIDNHGSFTTSAPMHVTISVPSLDGVELGGAGTVTVDGVTNNDFSAGLPGEGTLVVSGAAERVAAVLAGTGTLDLHELAATNGIAQLLGTGTIRVDATSTLDATLSGSGTILYHGDPTVTMHHTGTGTVAPE